MYAEITSKAFVQLVKNDLCKAVEVEELCKKSYWYVHGVKLMALYNVLSDVEQYYIEDINS